MHLLYMPLLHTYINYCTVCILFLYVCLRVGDEEAFTKMNSSVCGEFCGAGMTLILGTPICLWCHPFYFLILQYFIVALLHVYVLLYPCNDTRRIYGNCYGFVQQNSRILRKKQKICAIFLWLSSCRKKKAKRGHLVREKSPILSVFGSACAYCIS